MNKCFKQRTYLLQKLYIFSPSAEMSENNLRTRPANESSEISTSEPSNQNAEATLDYIEVLSKLHKNQSLVKFHIFVLTFFNIIYLTLQYFYFWNSFTALYILLFAFTYGVSWACMYFMKHMADLHVRLFIEQEKGNKNCAKLDLAESEEVIGSLGGLILYSVLVQMLTLFSNYFWLLLIIKLDYIKFFYFMRQQTKHVMK